MNQQTTNDEQTSFEKWGKRTKHSHESTNGAVMYTRVSSKEQAEKNLSLQFQSDYIVDYARRQGFEILASFGGTYESATSDGRREFVRMLEFIVVNKGRVSHILVYSR